MDWKEKIEAAKRAAEKGTHGLDKAAHAKIEEQWPMIQQIVRERIGPAAVKAAKDDDQMKVILKVVYEALPFPLRPMVKEEVFVQFCLARRDCLLPPADSATP